MNKPLKPLYRDDYSGGNQRRAEQLRKDKFAWKVGIVMITLISIVGIWAIIWAANL